MARSKKPSKMDYLKAEDFFRHVSARCNYVDTTLVKDVFYSMVKVIVQELKQRGVARLPDFGDFVITMHKARISLDVRSGTYRNLPVKRTVKFITDYKLKKYFNM